MAYGLPILHHLLSQPRRPPHTKRQLRALILAPTRELALQVSSHLNACLNSVDAPEALPAKKAKQGNEKCKDTDSEEHSTQKSNQPKSPPHVSVASIVGGMSAQKQRRILDRGVDVLVATPGRLWDIMQDVGHILLIHYARYSLSRCLGRLPCKPSEKPEIPGP